MPHKIISTKAPKKSSDSYKVTVNPMLNILLKEAIVNIPFLLRTNKLLQIESLKPEIDTFLAMALKTTDIYAFRQPALALKKALQDVMPALKANRRKRCQELVATLNNFLVQLEKL
jgi:hypothetical protein